MIRDLPNTVPDVVGQAAITAFGEYGRLESGRPAAQSAYDAHLELDQRTHDQPAGNELDALAAALFEWAETVHRALILDQIMLLDQMHRAGQINGPFSFTVVSHEIRLAAQPTAPAGLLKNRLDIGFEPDGWSHASVSIRCHAWFDGYLVGGGDIRRVGDVRRTIHSAMLREIHALVADGKVWDRIMFGLQQLGKKPKDG